MSGAGRYSRLAEVPIPEFMKRYKKGSGGEKYGISKEAYLLSKRFARICAYSRLIDKVEEANNAQGDPNAALKEIIQLIRSDIVALVPMIKDSFGSEVDGEGKKTDRIFATLEGGEEERGSLKNLLRLAKTTVGFRSFEAEIGGNKVKEKHVTVKKAGNLLHDIASAEFKIFLKERGHFSYFDIDKFKQKQSFIQRANQRKLKDPIESRQSREKARRAQRRASDVDHDMSVGRRRASSASSEEMGVHLASAAAGFIKNPSSTVVPVEGARVDVVGSASPLRASTLLGAGAMVDMAAQQVVKWNESDFYKEKYYQTAELDARVDEDLKELTDSAFTADDIEKFSGKRNQVYFQHLHNIYKDLIASVDALFDENGKKHGAIDIELKHAIAEKINDWSIEHLGRKLESSQKTGLDWALDGVLKSYASAKESLGKESAMKKFARSALAVGAFIANVVFVVTVVGPIVQAIRGKEFAEVFVPQELMKCYDPLSGKRKNILKEADQFLIDTIRAKNIDNSYVSGGKAVKYATLVKPEFRYKKRNAVNPKK